MYQVAPGGVDGEPELYTVETETYLDALDQLMPDTDGQTDDAYTAIDRSDLPDTIDVDRQGYAPAVEDQLGPGYMDESILVFDQDQQHADLVRQEFSFMDDLVDDVYDNKQFIEKATGSQPVSIDIHFDYTRSEFEVRALLSSKKVKQRLEEAMDLKDQAKAVDRTDLKQHGYLDQVQNDISSMLDSFGDLQEVELHEQLGKQTRDRFSVAKPEMEGYMFHGDPPVCIVNGGEAGRWEEMQIEFYSLEDGTPSKVSEALQHLYDAGEYTVDEDSAIEDLKWLGELILKDEEIEAEPGNISFYKKLKENRDNLPEEWHAVRDLVKNGDITIDEQDDAVKLYYIESSSDIAGDVLERSKDLVLEQDGFRERFLDLVDRVEDQAATDTDSDDDAAPVSGT